MSTKPYFITGTLALLCACGNSGTPSAQPEVRPVKVYVAQSLGSINKDFAGMSVADEISNLAFRTSGQILKMNVIEGQTVKKGDIIAEINPREYTLQMEADKATYLTAQSQMDRNKRLLDKQAISRQDYEMADASYVRAKSAYENAQTLLSDTRLRAPFSGAIEKKYVDNYQQVMAGEPVVRLVNPVTAMVKFTMPESGLQTLKLPGLQFSVRFDNLPGATFPARLKEYVQTSTQATGIGVTLTLDGPNLQKYAIAPGMSCMVNLRLNNPDRPDLTAVPLTAVYNRDDSDYVWTVGSGRRTELKPVELGELIGSDMIAVQKGLSPGDTVITAGIYRINPGETVKIIK